MTAPHTVPRHDGSFAGGSSDQSWTHVPSHSHTWRTRALQTVIVILASISISTSISTSGAQAAVPTPPVSADVPSAVAPVSTPSTSQAPPTSQPNDFLDLERSLTECISSNPPPGCGRVPTGPGDRGGWQQFVLFGVMMTGIAVIFWRVSRAVRGRNSAPLEK